MVGMLFLGAGLLAFGQERPTPVTVCQLENDPAAYNHKLLKVTAFVSHGFEDFSLFDLACHSKQSIWLEYGGNAKSGTVYCCGDTADRQRSRELVVEDMPIHLVDDERFHEFDKLLQPPFRSGRYGAIARATLVGRFFSGKKFVFPQATFWGGYGHLGCCSLFAIQEVKSVDAQNDGDLDYGSSSEQPDISKKGCGFQYLTPIDAGNNLLKLQRDAELERREWAFDDPRRVAIDAISHFANTKEQSITQLSQTRKAQGRHVYTWTPTGKAETYMVVVSRPYVLSFYARDPKRVAWVVSAAYLSSCGNSNAVTRLK